MWLAVVIGLAYCLDQELWKAIEYLKEQVRVLKEQQEKDNRALLHALGGFGRERCFLLASLAGISHYTPPMKHEPTGSELWKSR